VVLPAWSKPGGRAGAWVRDAPRGELRSRFTDIEPPRIEPPEPQAGQAISLIYEPITLAALPVYAARGVLGIVAAMLANLEPGSRSRHRWRCDPTAPLMTVMSFVETLSADGRRRLQSWPQRGSARPARRYERR
jgi:hypothetical protein